MKLIRAYFFARYILITIGSSSLRIFRIYVNIYIYELVNHLTISLPSFSVWR